MMGAKRLRQYFRNATKKKLLTIYLLLFLPAVICSGFNVGAGTSTSPSNSSQQIVCKLILVILSHLLSKWNMNPRKLFGGNTEPISVNDESRSFVAA